MPSKLEEMQQKFRERLVLEKEEKMIRIYSQNQQKVLERVSKTNSSALSHQHDGTSNNNKKLLSKPPLPTRKHGSGVDRSRPLKPIQLKPQNRPAATETVTRNGASCTANQDIPDMATRTTTLTVRTSVATTRPKPAAASSVKTPAMKPSPKPPAPATRALPAMTNGIKSSQPQVKPAVNGKSPQTKSAPATTSRSPITPSTSPKKVPASCPPVARAPPLYPNMAQCTLCGRNFDKERLSKHSEICKKTSVKKRKVFDATKMRVKGTEAEQFVRKGVHKKETPSKGKKTDWRVQHENFISSIRQAKAVQVHLAKGGKLSDLPPPKPSENPDYVQCPHCQRKFNEGVAERHIPKCKNILSNKKKPPAKK